MRKPKAHATALITNSLVETSKQNEDGIMKALEMVNTLRADRTKLVEMIRHYREVLEQHGIEDTMVLRTPEEIEQGKEQFSD